MSSVTNSFSSFYNSLFYKAAKCLLYFFVILFRSKMCSWYSAALEKSTDTLYVYLFKPYVRVIYCNCRGLFKLKMCQVIQDARLKTNATYTHNDFYANISKLYSVLSVVDYIVSTAYFNNDQGSIKDCDGWLNQRDRIVGCWRRLNWRVGRSWSDLHNEDTYNRFTSWFRQIVKKAYIIARTHITWDASW